MASPIAEPTARKISPLFFVLAGLCFLLPFAGVSCNTDSAKSTLGPLIAAAGGGANPQQSQQLNACLDALNNFNLATYTGVNLVAGSAPNTNSNAPDACNTLNQQTGGATATATNADQLKLGTQPLIVAAGICIVAGLLLGLLKLPLRGLIVAILAILAIVLLLIQQSRLTGLIGDKVTTAATNGTGASQALQGLSITSFFKTTMGIGLILCMVALALAALYNLASQVAGGSRRLATADAGAGPSGYPPSGYGQAPQPGYGAPPSAGYGGAPPPPPPGGGYAPPPPPPRA